MIILKNAYVFSFDDLESGGPEATGVRCARIVPLVGVGCSTTHVHRLQLANSGFSGRGAIGAARRRQALGLNTPDRSSAFDQVLCL